MSKLSGRLVAGFCALLAAGLAAGQQPPAGGGLTITILEGDNPIVNTRQRVSREAIIQVQDENHKPVAGALVTFLTPSDGPSALFANGSNTMTLTTDAQGRVTMSATANHVPGKFDIRITASKNGRTGTASITQTNVAAAAAGGAAGGISAKALLIIAGIGGAAAAGAAIALSNRGSGNTPANPGGTPASSGVTLVLGSPAVGPPR